jgi:hypothetical protein
MWPSKYIIYRLINSIFHIYASSMVCFFFLLRIGQNPRRRVHKGKIISINTRVSPLGRWYALLICAWSASNIKSILDAQKSSLNINIWLKGVNVPQKILTFALKSHLSNLDLDYMIRKEISQTSIPNTKYIFRKGNNKFKGLSFSVNLETWISCPTEIALIFFEICCSLCWQLNDSQSVVVYTSLQNTTITDRTL